MYNTKEEFLVDFQKWREQNNFPKRESVREIYRKYKQASEDLNALDLLNTPKWCYYVSEQEKPSMFLDSLFKKDSSICKNDPKSEITQEVKKTDEDYKLEIINAFYAYARENKSVPSFKVLNSQLGYKVQKYFQDEKDLYYACATVYDIQDYLLNETMFCPEYTRETLDIIKNHRRFLVTTAVAGKKVNKLLLKSMLNYCERKDAIILVLPSQDVFNRKSKFEFELDPELKNDRVRVVYHDLFLNENVMLSDIKVSAKAVHPLTGLDGFCKYATTIVGSVKQDSRAVPNLPDKCPNFILGTGTITEPDFSTDAYMSMRLSKLVEDEVVMGGIVVEVESEKLFHLREFQSGKSGEIIDVGERYWPDGNWNFVNQSVMVYGDLHSEDIDENVFKCEKEISVQAGVKTSVLHDITSFSCISHHNENKFVTQAIMSDGGKTDLKSTIQITAGILEQICDINKEVAIVPSNHHEHYSLYLETGRFVQDRENSKYAVQDYIEMLNGETIPLRSALKRELIPSCFDKIKWIGKNEGYDKYEVELSNHGHISANGGRGNALRTYKKMFKKSVSAHAHSPERVGGAIRVGMSTKKFIGYNFGPSSWMPSVVLVYENGSTQTINIIEKDGKYTWKI